jgi:carboxyl-terminal processing protease
MHVLRKAFFAICVFVSAGINSPVSAENEDLPGLVPTREMRLETICMVRCMEELHLEHKEISLLDNRAVLMDFFEEIDPAKMIFLRKDIDEFLQKFSPVLDILVSGGNLNSAFAIFERFRVSASARIDWILARLDRPFDFSKDETFCSNRKNYYWPTTAEEADALWEKRLKFEISNEVISLCKAKKKEFANCRCGCENSCEGEGSAEVKFSACACAEDISCGEEDIANALDEAVGTIRRRYESWRRSCRDIDPWLVQEMFLTSISRMYDPHSSFLSKDSFDNFIDIHIRNSLTGIGVELRYENGVCTVNKLTPGGPAKRSGEIKDGDKIVAIAQGDGGEFADVVGLRLHKLVRLLRGPKDTVVRVKLETVAGDTKTVRLVRDHIKLNEMRARGEYFELEKDGEIVRIGVIELPSFYGDGDNDKGVQAIGDVRTLLAMLKEKKIDGLVLDLRQNGGGLLHQAVAITGLFIKTGLVVQVKDSDGKIEKLFDDDASIAWKGPLVVLSSSLSASASEILIGALRDHKRAVIVGAKATYGKGSVQFAFDMNKFSPHLGWNKDLGAAYITTQKWYLPTGTSTQLRGVPADIKLAGLDECFHRREADYPHALDWDTIPPADFNDCDAMRGVECRVTDDLIAALGGQSAMRQETMEEFAILRERIDHFDTAVNREIFPLKISVRLAEKKLDDDFKREMNYRVKALVEKQDYASESVELPDINRDEDDLAGYENSKESVDGIAIFDTNLRECLRIIADWEKILHPQRFGDISLTSEQSSEIVLWE